jgi:hypothetical protein
MAGANQRVYSYIRHIHHGANRHVVVVWRVMAAKAAAAAKEEVKVKFGLKKKKPKFNSHATVMLADIRCHSRGRHTIHE